MYQISPKDEMIITQFTNPHLFWLRKVDFDFDPEFRKFNEEFRKYYKKNFQKLQWKTFQPKKGDKVAYFDSKEKVWYRAELDECQHYLGESDATFSCWLMDYGRTVEAQQRDLKELDDQFKDANFGHIIKAGIRSIMPAEEEVNFYTNEKKLVRVHDWPKSVVQRLMVFLDDVPLITFHPHEKMYIKEFGHIFGDLVVQTHAGAKESIRQKLLNLNACVSLADDKFLNEILKSDILNHQRSRDNQGHRFGRKTLGQTSAFVTTKKKAFEPDDFSIVTEDAFVKVETWMKTNETRIETSEQEAQIFDDVGPAVDEIPPLVTNDDDEGDEGDLMSNMKNISIYSDKESAVSVTPRLPKTKKKLPSPSASPLDKNSPPKTAPLESGEKQKFDIMKYLAERRAAMERGEVPATVQKQSYDVKLIPHDYAPVLDAERNKSKKYPVAGAAAASGGKANKKLPDPPSNQKPEKARSNVSSESGGSSKVMDIVRRTKYNPANNQRKKEAEKPEIIETPQLLNSKVRAEYEELLSVNLEEKLTFQAEYTRKVTDDDGINRLNLENPIVLVHGKRLLPKISRHEDANFTFPVEKYMSSKHREIRRIQSFVWPHLMAENSAVIIGAASTGKTLSYVPAVCSIIDRLLSDSDKIDGKGPIGIIILPSGNDVNKVFRMCRQIFDRVQQKSTNRVNFVVQAYGRHKHEEVEGQLLEGAGLLLVTPACLDRLRTNEPRLFNKSKIKLLVIDDYDICHKRFGKLMDDLISEFYVRHSDGDPTQVVVVSNLWENNLLKYCKYGKNPALFISHYAESALYGRTEFKITYKQKNQKIEYLSEVLGTNQYENVRTAVICATDEEVEKVSSILMKQHQIRVTPYTIQSNESDRIQAIDWHTLKSPNLTVLIASDASLVDLVETKNVQCLINYSMPESSWFRLSVRFSLMFEYFHNYVVKGPAPEEYKPEARILIDETENPNCFLRFVEFMKRTNAKIPQDCIKYANIIAADRENRRQSIRLCPYFLQFGECCTNQCRDRHTLNENDKPGAYMPKEGQTLKLKMSHVHHPTHYSARILEFHNPGERNWHKYDQAYVEVGLKLINYYRNDDNLQSVGRVKKGDFFTWTGEADRYQRCQVLDVNEGSNAKMDLDRNTKVVLRLIDTGRVIFNQPVSNLVVLPPDLQAYPPQAVDIHLTGYVPYDGDINWDRETTEMINRMLMKHDDRVRQGDDQQEYYVQLCVNYVLQDNIFSSKISTVEYFKQLQKKQEIYPIHKVLLRKCAAKQDPNEKGITKIKELAKQCGLFDNADEAQKLTPQPEKPIIVEPEIPKQARGTFDYLEQDKNIAIQFDHFDNCSSFYVMRIDRFDKLAQLYDKIDEFTENPQNRVDCSVFETNRNVLGLLADNYSRCRIAMHINEDPPMYEVYTVDGGDLERLEASALINVPDEITNFISFAAIRGRLVGTLPNNSEEGYSEEEKDKMMNEINKWHGQLYARVTRMNENTDYWNRHTGLNFYDLLLIGYDGQEVVILNSKFVEEGLVKPDPEFPLANISPVAIQREFEKEKDDDDAARDTDDVDADDWEDLIGTYQKEKVVEKVQVAEDLDDGNNVLSSLQTDDFDDEEWENVIAMCFPQLLPVWKKQKEDAAKNEKEQIESPKKEEVKEEKLEKVKQDKSDTKSEKSKQKPLNLLTQMYRSPQVIWQQNDEIILLQIRIGDVEDYYLEITHKELIFQMYDLIDNEPRALALIFFGVVDVNRTSYEKRGLNLVVRLAKAGFEQWPRLLEMEDKLNYIKYNLDQLNVIDQHFVFKKSKKPVVRVDSSDDYDSDSSMDYCSEDDDLDNPLADGFIK